MKIEIREEQPEDRAEVRRINEAAFGRPEEAEIVDNLRDSCGDLLSLVAIVDELPLTPASGKVQKFILKDQHGEPDND